MKRPKQSATRATIALVAVIAIAGCNTVAGVGEDITGVARWTQGSMGMGGSMGYFVEPNGNASDWNGGAGY
ncbi:hypothetical protein MLD63_02750 (plasmid) [Paracoccus sp. TK19116]|uniref:Lipoprotein n=1 Tax=Paracoccus albicereus TaxID=2922394 RepID=A0ABT1MMF6_9RHOB|nr:hypothetical protein [Paracoccus albicereus]MCQ0969356.1 hypothetical protein [Paracoccus albicereus]